MIKAFIVILIIIGLFLYAIVHVSARSVDDDMQKFIVFFQQPDALEQFIKL